MSDEGKRGWRPGNFVGLMDNQIVAVECSLALEEKARSMFPGAKVRVIERADADFWAVITHAEPFIEAQSKAGEMSARMATMLRRLEWADTGEPATSCYVCHGFQSDGHAPACDLATLLRELP